MKRTMCLFALAAIVFALPASHLLFSGPSDQGQVEAVKVCHIQGKEIGKKGKPVDKKTGVILSISETAAAHHVAHHKDCTGKAIIKVKGGGCGCDCLTQCSQTYAACKAGCNNDLKCISKCKANLKTCQVNCKKVKPPTKS